MQQNPSTTENQTREMKGTIWKLIDVPLNRTSILQTKSREIVDVDLWCFCIVGHPSHLKSVSFFSLRSFKM